LYVVLVLVNDEDRVFRQLTIQGVIDRVKDKANEVVVYERVLESDEFDGLRVIRVIKDFAEFKETADVIVTNRLYDELKSVRDKVNTRDL